MRDLADRADTAGRVMALPGEPARGVLTETLLPKVALEVGLSARSVPLLLVDLGQPIEC